MLVFKTLEQLTSYLTYVPKLSYLTVCHNNGIFKRGYGGDFVCFVINRGKCIKVFYSNSLYFQISCFMYKAVDPVDEKIIKLLKKTITIENSEEDEIFCACPFTNNVFISALPVINRKIVCI